MHKLNFSIRLLNRYQNKPPHRGKNINFQNIFYQTYKKDFFSILPVKWQY